MNNNLTKIYEQSPWFIQNVFISLYGLKLWKREYGKQFHNWMIRFEQMEWWSKGELENYQNEQLAKLIIHCYENVPYYREVMDLHHLKPSDIRTVDDLHKMPILTSDIIRTRNVDMISSTVKRSELIPGRTSGTTGSPLQFYYDRQACIIKNVVDWRQKRWGGINFRDKMAMFFGHLVVPTSQKSPPFWRSNLTMNQIWFSSLHMTKKNLALYIDKLERSSIVAIDSYPSTGHILSKFLLKEKKTLPLKAFFTSSETLYPEQRMDIERAFECPLFDYYGLAERVAFATECNEHRGHHLNSDYAVAEILNSDSMPVPNGELGRIVGTGLYNYAMPLIRYRTSDVTSLATRNCSCNRHFPLMGDVTTKAEDIVVTADGRYLPPSALHHPFMSLSNIAESQVIQNSTEHILIKIVKQSANDEVDKQALLREFVERVGEGIKVDVEFVDSIERTKAGKFRWVISKVPLDF